MRVPKRFANWGLAPQALRKGGSVYKSLSVGGLCSFIFSSEVPETPTLENSRKTGNDEVSKGKKSVGQRRARPGERHGARGEGP